MITNPLDLEALLKEGAGKSYSVMPA